MLRVILFVLLALPLLSAQARDYAAAPIVSFDQPTAHRKLRAPKLAPAEVAPTPGPPSSAPDPTAADPAPTLEPAPDPMPGPGDTAAAQAFSPHARGAADATALVVKTIAGAQTAICAAAYSFTSAPIADALLAARARGVQVRLTLDKSQARGRHVMLTRLLAAQLPVRVNTHYAIMHDKFMVIDARVLQLGSFNYTKSAETKNAENVLVIRRYKKVIAAYQTECDRLWDEATEPAALPPSLNRPVPTAAE